MANALVIDDNRQSADSVCKILNLLGVKAEAAYGPRAAIYAINRSIPDIVFMDINMPGVDGFEVMAYLRRLPQMADVPVVFVTSDDQSETARKVRRTGALQLVIKPASIDLIERVLRDANLI